MKEDKSEITPTPTKIVKKEPEKKKTEKTSIFKFVHVAGQFLRESKIELKKVKWPTRKELLASTAMVIFLVLVVALFLGLIDFGFLFVRTAWKDGIVEQWNNGQNRNISISGSRVLE